MRCGKLNKVDTANGIGCRVSLFVSGCRRHCKGCHNEVAWDFGYGQKFTQATVAEILKALEPDWIDGLSILGGEPLEPENILDVENLCMMVKDKFPNKTIWLYTGSTWENICSNNITNYIDVLVDGAYVEEQRNLTLPFRGSENQRIIDVRQSLRKRRVVLYEFKRCM